MLSAMMQFAAGHLTASRAAFVALTPFLVACFIATLVVSDRGARKKISAACGLALAIMLAVGTVVALLNADFVQDFFSVFSTRGFDLGRSKVWKQSIEFFLENPIFGLGLMHHDEIQQAAISYFWMSHNTILQALSSLGIVGFTGLMIHTLIKYKTFAKRNYFSYFCMIMIIATELYGMIDCLMPAPYYVMPLFLLLIVADRTKAEFQKAIPPLKNLR